MVIDITMHWEQVWIGQVDVNVVEMFSDRLAYDQEENGEINFGKS